MDESGIAFLKAQKLHDCYILASIELHFSLVLPVMIM
jgi:hypothetical protein